MDHGFKCTVKTRTLFKKKKKKPGYNHQDLGLDKEFMCLAPKAACIKGKMDKLDLLETENFCSVKVCDDEKLSYGLTENIYKPHIQQKTSVWNI